MLNIEIFRYFVLHSTILAIGFGGLFWLSDILKEKKKTEHELAYRSKNRQPKHLTKRPKNN